MIAGPRQVGKSTLVKQALQDTSLPHLMVSADAVSGDDRLWIDQVWDSARSHLLLSGAGEFLLVIDEVHKVPNWSESVKKNWDEDSFNDINIKVVLLGSSRLLLKDGLTESLMGRFEIIHMTHWSYSEMKQAFGMDIQSYIYYGGYPGAASLLHDEARWRKYIKDSIITPAIEKDVLMTKKLYKPVLMKRLFELGCEYSGEELSLTKILGMLSDAGNVTTLANYLSTLDESRLLCGLQKFARDNARKCNSIPKFLVYNNALLSALSSKSFEATFTNPKVWGRWVESAVGAHLLNLSITNDYKVYYWRESNDEVDYIVEYNGECIAIEVKSGRRTTNKGLSVFGSRFGAKHSFVVGSGGFPIEDFLLLSTLSPLFR